MAAPHMHLMQLFILVLVQVAWLATPSLCDSSPAPGDLQNHDVALFLGNTQALHSITEFNHADIVNSANYFIPEDPKLFKASSVSFRFRGGTSKNSSGSFFSIPFCRQASDGNPCSFHGYKPIVEFRFRHGTERYFSLHARTNPHPPPSTQKIIQSMQEKLKAEVGGEVGFPSVMGTDNVDYDETCAEITDECFLSSHATYTTSHKGMSTGDFSGRFFLRASPSEGVWRFVLHSISPLTHNVTVDVVVLLLPPPTPFSSLWWLDTWLGSTLLAVLCLGCVMGFLLICKELSIQHAGGAQRQVPSVFAAPPDHWENNVACHLMQIELVLRAVFSGAAVRLWTLLRSLPQRLGHSSSESAPLYHHGDGEDRGRDSAVICTNGEEEEEGPTCRICRCAEPTSDLFSPCACNGSCRYVHHDCLERWRSMTTNPEHRLVCAECKSPYRLVRGDALGGSSRFGSYVIAPALRSLGQGLARAVLWSGFLLLAVQYLKYSFFLVTGRDPGVEWNLWSGYNIVLGVYVAIALKLNLAILQPVISSVRSDSEQLILLLVSLVTVEIPMSYVGGYILWVMFDRWNSAEVSYGLGIASTGAAYFIMGERLARLLESLSSVRETVAPRDEA